MHLIQIDLFKNKKSKSVKNHRNSCSINVTSIFMILFIPKLISQIILQTNSNLFVLSPTLSIEAWPSSCLKGKLQKPTWLGPF